MIERVKKVIEQKSKSVREFSLMIGVKQVTLNQQILGSRSLSLDTVVAILNSFEDISAEWLLRGKGEMYARQEEPNLEWNAKVDFLNEKEITIKLK